MQAASPVGAKSTTKVEGGGIHSARVRMIQLDPTALWRREVASTSTVQSNAWQVERTSATVMSLGRPMRRQATVGAARWSCVLAWTA
eukprot:16061784-Heterocapsa_arctica.AAC.1